MGIYKIKKYFLGGYTLVDTLGYLIRLFVNKGSAKIL